jgi:beta-glucosidase
MGLFDMEDSGAGDPTRIVGSPGHAHKAREAAEAAFVLLENRRETLPLDANRIWTLAMIGPGAEPLTEVSSDRPVYRVSPLRGLKDYARGRFDVIHAEGCRPETSPDDWELLEQAEAAAVRADAVILVLTADGPGGMIGGRQEQLLENVTDRGTPVILIILSDTVPILPEQAERARAVLVGFAPGQETGRALARLLFGETDFRGRLPVSLSETYPAGYGLATTEFLWSQVRHERGLLTLAVTNTGTRRGTETVQLYLSRRSVGNDWPEREPADFRQMSLEPGETRTVTFFPPPRE